MVEELTTTRYVYHYTSFETLLAIMDNYRKSKDRKELIFHASNIFMMNDPKEMERGYDVVKEFLKEHEADIPLSLWLHDLANNKEYEKTIKSDYAVGDKKYLTEPGIIPYTISFSAKRDFLPMWSLYGKKGLGVCLKFDTFDIIKHVNPEMSRQVGFVSYDKTSGFKEIRNLLVKTYGWYLDAYKDNTYELTIEKKIREIGNLCFYISPFLKYKDYKYEKEFRLAYYKHYGDSVNSNISLSDLLQPKVYKVDTKLRVSIPASALKEIIIGPSISIDTRIAMSHVIKKELDECNLKVKISNSKVPFRLN